MKIKSTPLKDFVKKNKKRNSKIKKEVFKTDFDIIDSDEEKQSNDQIFKKSKRKPQKNLNILEENLKEESNNFPERKDEGIFEKLIDLSEISKSTGSKCTNIDIILSIIEVIRNKDLYNLSSSERSNQFWENAKEKFSVFADFKSETLRKYWRPISGNVDKTINLINEIKSIKGVELIKLLPLLNFIQKNLDNELTLITDELNKLIQKENKFESKDYLKKKRAQKKDTLKKKEDDEFTIKLVHLNKRTQENNQTQKEKKVTPEVKKIVEQTKGEVKHEEKKEINYQEKDKYDCLSEITETLEILLKERNYTKEEIIDALEKNSLNIIKTYDYLVEKDDDIIFTKNEDYIITNLRDTPQYQSILDTKGIKAVEARLSFLNKI